MPPRQASASRERTAAVVIEPGIAHVMPAETLSLRQLNRATLARQMLLDRAEATPLMVVERLAGMQAQEPKPPFIGLWSRLRDFQRRDLHQALQAKTLVRGTLMRGTIHLVSASDYAAFRQTLQPVLDRGLSALGDRAEGLDEARVLSAARELLAERPRTFGELRGLLQEQFPEMHERALGFLTRMRLPLVMTPADHPWAFPANADFALAESWLGEPLAPGENSRDLALRYLAAFGPATVADLQTWSGLPRMKPTLDALRPELVTFRDEQGRELFDLPDAPRPVEETPAPARFLPEFDNLLLSHADRTRVIADEHRGLVYQKGNLRLLASFLVDGVVSGAWRVERKRKAATLRMTAFVPLAKDARADLEAEGEALLRFIEEDAATHEIVYTT
jgi:hypothetical protein